MKYPCRSDIFFFSSRRRHTRSLRDWSSDVCSSDLFMHFRAQRSARMLMEDLKISFDELVRYKHSTRMELADRILDDLASRSEERRVGKECRSGWWEYH